MRNELGSLKIESDQIKETALTIKQKTTPCGFLKKVIKTVLNTISMIVIKPLQVASDCK